MVNYQSLYQSLQVTIGYIYLVLVDDL